MKKPALSIVKKATTVIVCPHCKRAYRITDDWHRKMLGKEVICFSCQEKFIATPTAMPKGTRSIAKKHYPLVVSELDESLRRIGQPGGLLPDELALVLLNDKVFQAIRQVSISKYERDVRSYDWEYWVEQQSEERKPYNMDDL